MSPNSSQKLSYLKKAYIIRKKEKIISTIGVPTRNLIQFKIAGTFLWINSGRN